MVRGDGERQLLQTAQILGKGQDGGGVRLGAFIPTGTGLLDS